MLRIFRNDPLFPLLERYHTLMKEANLLAVINQKLARQRLVEAQCIALQIHALRFRN